MADSLALLLLLVGLELVLGVDNILVISIFVGRLPESHRNRARIFGLALALLARVIMLFVLLRLTSLTNPVLFHLCPCLLHSFLPHSWQIDLVFFTIQAHLLSSFSLMCGLQP